MRVKGRKASSLFVIFRKEGIGMNLLTHRLKLGIKRGFKTPEYYVAAALIGAVQAQKFSKGDEPFKRAVEAGVASAAVALVGEVIMNGVAVIIYNRYPQAPEIYKNVSPMPNGGEVKVTLY